MVLRMLEYMEKDFRQCEIEGTKGRATALVSKKGRVTVKRKSYAKTGETAGNGEGTGSGAGNRNFPITGRKSICWKKENRFLSLWIWVYRPRKGKW